MPARIALVPARLDLVVVVVAGALALAACGGSGSLPDGSRAVDAPSGDRATVDATAPGPDTARPAMDAAPGDVSPAQDAAAMPDTGSPAACTLHATPATLAGTFASAGAGAVICLAAGSYGAFAGGVRPGRVTVRPESGAAVTLAVQFAGAQNVTLDGLTITGLDMTHSRDVTVSHSRFTGQAIVHAGMVADANLVFDGNDHRGVLTCATGCFAAQLHLDPEGTNPSGVAIRNSHFGDSFADGVRADVDSVLVEDSEFSGFADMDPYHCDPIQIYGGTRVTIRRSFFHDNAVASNVGGWDGNDHNVVEDNVIVGGPSTGEAVALASDNGSVIQHNTLVQGACMYGWHCGVIDISHRATDPASHGTVVRDNVYSNFDDTDAVYTSDHNLSTDAQTPVYVGPATTYAGYRLAPGSPGVHAASDGLDVGIR